jgi:uncharacterized protein
MTIERNREEILRIAARHGARNVRVFGSVARREDRSIATLICWSKCKTTDHSWISWALNRDLEELLQRKVDVLTDASIHPAIRQRMTAEARAL